MMSDETDVDDVNIQHFKLSTGEDIIGIVLQSDDESLIHMQRPMQLKFIEYEDGVGFIFYEYQPLSKHETAVLNPHHVVSYTECTNDVKLQYINACVNDTYSISTDSGDIEDVENNLSLPSDKSKYYH